MHTTSNVNRTRCRTAISRGARAALLMLAVSHALTTARAAEPEALRRLPPVSDLNSAALLPAPPPKVVPPADATTPAKRPDPGVVHPEHPDFQNQLAPDDGPPLRQTSRQEPVKKLSAQPALHFQIPNDPLRVAAKQDPDNGSPKSPFSDEPEMPTPPPPDNPSADAPAASQDPLKKKDGEPQTFGPKPVSNSLQFLRTQDVLLNPGDYQVDTGFAYTLFDNSFPATITDGGGNVVDVVKARERDRLVYTPLAVRYGWSKNVQLFGILPTGFSNTQISTIGASQANNNFGIGDLTGGASFHLLKACDDVPDVIGTFSFTAPTGDFNAPVGALIPGVALGQGFWALSGQLLCVNRYDPIIAFYGVGFRHLFEREFAGFRFQPGEQLSYQFGVGFAVNDRVTLSATFFGFYISDTLVERVALQGSNVEPMSMRFAMTVARRERIVEPFVQLGMTDFAPRASLGVTVTFY